MGVIFRPCGDAGQRCSHAPSTGAAASQGVPFAARTVTWGVGTGRTKPLPPSRCQNTPQHRRDKHAQQPKRGHRHPGDKGFPHPRRPLRAIARPRQSGARPTGFTRASSQSSDRNGYARQYRLLRESPGQMFPPSAVGAPAITPGPFARSQTLRTAGASGTMAAALLPSPDAAVVAERRARRATVPNRPCKLPPGISTP